MYEERESDEGLEHDFDLTEEHGYSNWEPRPFPLRRWMLIGGVILVLAALLLPALVRILG